MCLPSYGGVCRTLLSIMNSEKKFNAGSGNRDADFDCKQGMGFNTGLPVERLIEDYILVPTRISPLPALLIAPGQVQHC